MQPIVQLVSAPSRRPARALSGSTVVLGNFDGVHRGHVAVLETARQLKAPLILVTFEPHPRAVLHPQAEPFRLTSETEKRRALLKAGVDEVITLRFDADLAALGAAAFVERVVVDQLAARHVVVGHDYRFGRGREGDDHLLAALGEQHGFSVVTACAAKTRLGERFSSSAVRDRIVAGDMIEAGRLLGRPWSVTGDALPWGPAGSVLPLGEHLRPMPGRYAVTIQSDTASPFPAIAVSRHELDDLMLSVTGLIGPVTVWLHQRLGSADQTPTLAEGRPIDATISARPNSLFNR